MAQVKRLGMNRSRWLDHQLTTALEDTLQDVLVGPTVPVWHGKTLGLWVVGPVFSRHIALQLVEFKRVDEVKHVLQDLDYW